MLEDKLEMTFKIEAGKYYRTRNGRKAYVLGTNPFEHADRFSYIGFIQGEPEEYWWDEKGRIDVMGERGYDLVEEITQSPEQQCTGIRNPD